MTSPFRPEKFTNKPKPPPAVKEIEHGNYLLMIFRFIGVPMPKHKDEVAVERVGQLLTRWWRNMHRD